MELPFLCSRLNGSCRENSRAVNSAKARQVRGLLAKLEAEGLTASEARDTVDVGISNTLSLGGMLGVVEGFEERVELARGRGELGEQEEAASYAYVVRKNAPVGDAMRLVLLRARGLATNSQMFEEAMEQGALARMREMNGGEEVTPEMVRAYGEALQQLQRELNERDGGKGAQFIDVTKEAPELRDVVEAFSLMGRSRLLREMMAGRSSLPEHVQAPFLYASRYMDRFADQVKLADALADALKRDASGQVQGMLDVLQNAVDAVYESPAAREPFEIEEARKRFEAMKQAWKKAEEQEQAALSEEGQIEEPGSTQERQPGTGEAHFSLADNSPLHLHENGIQYTRNGSFYTADAADLVAPGMAVEGGVPEAEGGVVEARPDGRADSGAGSGVQQGQSDRRAGLPLEELRRVENGGRADGIRLVTRRLHRFVGAEQEKSALQEFYKGDLCELAPGKESAATFTDAIEAARQSHGLKGECVYVYPAEEYEGMRLFLTPDGMAGMALKEDGDMVSVFSHTDRGGKKDGNAARSLIALAINEGAIKGDCYGRKLVELYGRFGFRPVAKDRFNPEFASEAMQNEDAMRANFAEEDGRPDVVYLVYEGDRTRVLDEYDPTYSPAYQTELEYTGYDASLERQNEAVEQQRQKESGASSNFSIIGGHVAGRLRMKAAERARVDFSVSALGPGGKVLTPATYITKPDGNPDWFVLPARKGQPAMPVRLLVGADRGPHKGYGLTHIAASRDADGLWQSVSPEKYLTSILSHVSELWEIVPGREILIKGTRPASWMVLQLIESDGYYSIISAHPVSGDRKPTGKKLPLAERVADRSRTRVDRSQRPANPDAVPGAFSGSHELSTATQATTAGGEDAPSIPQSARVVNINDVQLRFDDGGMMPAAFSIQDAGDLLGVLSRLQAAAEGIDLQGDALYDAPIVRMRAAVTRQIERLSRYGDFGESGSGLSELASAYVLLDEVERALPGNYGFGLEAYKTWTQFFIRLMKTGRIDEAAATLPMSGWPEVMQASIGRQVEEYLAAHPAATAAEFLQEYGEQRLMRLVGKFMERARQQLDRYRKDVELGRMRRIVAAVAPRRNAQGKPLRSKMSANDYREVERLMRLVNMTSGQYDEAIEAWEKKKDANGNGRDFNEARDEEEMLMDVYDASGAKIAAPCTVREFRTLGSWERMSVGEVTAARSVLGELIKTGRLSWEAALERRRSMLSRQAERLDAAFSNLTESEKKELLKAFRNKKSELNVFAPMESLAPFLDVLRVVPGLGDVADGWALK